MGKRSSAALGGSQRCCSHDNLTHCCWRQAGDSGCGRADSSASCDKKLTSECNQDTSRGQSSDQCSRHSRGDFATCCCWYWLCAHREVAAECWCRCFSERQRRQYCS